MTTVRQPAIAVGRTQASTVIPVVRSSVARSATVTQSLTPSNDRALPLCPAVVQVAPEIVPAGPLPDLSAVVVPAPSSNPKAATRPAAPGSLSVIVTTPWPSASVALV